MGGKRERRREDLIKTTFNKGKGGRGRKSLCCN
jgi:hypothetical protein